MEIQELKKLVRDIPDFPKPGIMFKDISGLLDTAKTRTALTHHLAKSYKNDSINVVVGIEARGFLFGPLLADALGAQFVMLRKPGKLPGNIISQSYDLEYGTDSIEIQANAIMPGDNVLIHDDVLATGGTALAAIKILHKVGANITGFSFIMELDFLEGRKLLENMRVETVLNY
jgi:adenine phosphoribosyltransferase